MATDDLSSFGGNSAPFSSGAEGGDAFSSCGVGDALPSCGAGDALPSCGAGDAFPSVDSEDGCTYEEYIEHLANKYSKEKPEEKKASKVQVVELKDEAYNPVEEFDELSPRDALEMFVNHRTFPSCTRNVNGNDCVVFSVKNPYTDQSNPRSWATRLYIAVPADCGATVAQFEDARKAWLAIQ